MLNLERLDRLIDTIGTKLGQRIDDPAAAGEAAGKLIASLGEGGGRAKRSWVTMLGLGGGPSLVDAAGQGGDGPALLDSLGLRGGGPSLLNAAGAPQASWRERPSLLGTLGGGIAQDGRVSLIGAIAPKVPKAPSTPTATDYPIDPDADPYGATQPYEALYREMAAQHGDINQDELVEVARALTYLESRGRAGAQGVVVTEGPYAGQRAQGLMQVMPGNAPGANLLDPRTNIRYGMGILADNFKRYGDWDRAVAAYFGAIKDGQITGAKDDNGTDGYSYVNQVRGFREQVRNGRAPAALPNGGNLVAAARSLIGTPYVLGGLRASGDPRKGLDCSEFTAWVYQQAGVKIPWNAQAQFNATQRVGAGQLQAGDLVFFHSTNPADPDYVTHVGMYIGNGQMINSQDGGVMTADLKNQYWATRIAGYGRVKR